MGLFFAMGEYPIIDELGPWHFSRFVLKHLHYFDFTEKRTQTKNQQLFDGLVIEI
jgi:hypothetical protein